MIHRYIIIHASIHDIIVPHVKSRVPVYRVLTSPFVRAEVEVNSRYVHITLMFVIKGHISNLQVLTIGTVRYIG